MCFGPLGLGPFYFLFLVRKEIAKQKNKKKKKKEQKFTKPIFQVTQLLKKNNLLKYHYVRVFTSVIVK